MRNILHIYSTQRQVEYAFRNFIKLNESIIESAQQHTVVIGDDRHTFKTIGDELCGMRFNNILFDEYITIEEVRRIASAVSCKNGVRLIDRS